MLPLFKVFTPTSLNISTINEIIQSGNLSFSRYGRQFENSLREYVGNKYILTTSNNNYAMLIAFAAIGLVAGDEVIASPMACLASNQPILNFQAKVVWADVDPLTGTLDPLDVRKKITPKTKAILHYHWGGFPGYIDEINEIGLEYGIQVIDDAIEAFGSEYKNNKLGNTNTPITCFSFQAVRLPNTVDGGAIAFKSEDLYNKAKLIRDFGIDRSTFRDRHGEISARSDINLFGYNAMMSELNSFLGIEQMKQVDQLITAQRNNARFWDNHFTQSGDRLINKRSEVLPNYWIYSALVEYRIERMHQLRKEGYYCSSVHLRNDLYSVFGKRSTELKGTDEFAHKQISVPSGWWATLA
ncbi:MAG: aminotransferase DegT [Sphingobacteriales bacterium]|nr:MAG: aminotransferase DegT [Sphingobacteriales bacterium]